MNAKETVMTVEYRKKITDQWIMECINDKIKGQKDLKNNKNLQELSNNLVAGEQQTMTCFVLKSENKLGRSSVIDLNKPWNFNFR